QEAVEQGVDGGVGHRGDHFAERRAERADLLKDAGALVGRARPAPDEGAEGLAVELRGEERQRRGDEIGGGAGERPGGPRPDVAWLKSPQVQPPSARAVFARGSTRIPFIRERSITTPPSFVPNPGALCAPPRMETSPFCPCAKATAAMTSVTPAHRITTAGLRS